MHVLPISILFPVFCRYVFVFFVFYFLVWCVYVFHFPCRFDDCHQSTVLFPFFKARALIRVVLLKKKKKHELYSAQMRLAIVQFTFPHSNLGFLPFFYTVYSLTTRKNDLSPKEKNSTKYILRTYFRVGIDSQGIVIGI